MSEICEGTFDPMKCLECPRTRCTISSDLATRGGITKDIEEALYGSSVAREVEEQSKQHDAYVEHRRERLAYQKRKTEENRKRYTEAQACIKTVRNAHGLGQLELAKLLGVTQTTISRWELGKSPADWDLLATVLPELEEMRP